MNKTINGYAYDLPHLRDLRETLPGFWRGATELGVIFWIIGGSRMGAARGCWWAICPTLFGAAAREAHSLAGGLCLVDTAASPG